MPWRADRSDALAEFYVLDRMQGGAVGVPTRQNISLICLESDWREQVFIPEPIDQSGPLAFLKRALGDRISCFGPQPHRVVTVKPVAIGIPDPERRYQKV